MANANMYGNSIFSGLPLWCNSHGYNQHKANRAYNGVEDLSSALGGMQMYGNNGQSFGRLHAGLPPGLHSGVIPAPFTGSNVWTNGSRLFMPNGNPGMVTQGSHFQSIPNNGLGMPGTLANGNLQPGEIPDLARRNSLSSNEEYGPRTPFFAAQSLGPGGKMIVPDNSPQTWTSVSPPQLGQAIQASPQQLWREANGYVVIDLDALCMKAPAIPKPIPAIFSGDKSRGTLETSLENKTHTTNVYIRGLHPDTTDEMLNAYGSRFGVIESAKSMIDQHTSLCKGFGFIKYQSYKDGENCIRGFYHRGYESKWARDSHNDKLKKLGDEGNTNLYISNIPIDLDFNEHALSHVFEGFDCLSAKILRDPNGLSRGVGFARFASPEECRMIIQKFNGMLVGRDSQPISIRFADTPDQKRLKLVTQERRQYKTHEYNVAAFGPDSPYRHYGPLVAAHSPIPLNRPILATQPWINPSTPAGLGFGMGSFSSIPISTTATAASAKAMDGSPLAGRNENDYPPYPFPLAVKTEDTPEDDIEATNKTGMEAVALAKRNANIPAKTKTDTSVKLGQSENASIRGSTLSSPVKATPVKSTKPGILAKVAGTN